MKYDLDERTAKFGESIILFCKKFKSNSLTKPLISQLIRSGTSVGANYMEANAASSRKDFRNKIYICKKEIQETKYWLRMMSSATPELKAEANELWKEAHELTLIFQKITMTINKNKP